MRIPINKRLVEAVLAYYIKVIGISQTVSCAVADSRSPMLWTSSVLIYSHSEEGYFVCSFLAHHKTVSQR